VGNPAEDLFGVGSRGLKKQRRVPGKKRLERNVLALKPQ